MSHDRRKFLKGALSGAAALGLAGAPEGAQSAPRREFKISVAGWSLHKAVFDEGRKQIDLFQQVREDFDIGAFELVNTMLEDPTADYVRRLHARAKEFSVAIPLIMIDREGSLGAQSSEDRKTAVRNHTKWIDVASDLGCHSIRVNWRGAERGVEKDEDRAREFIARSVDTFAELVELGRPQSIDIIIENHGGPSSYPELLIGLIDAVGSPHFGTLPDFGNFPDDVDRYDAVDKMMPHAKALSAKCYDFGADGLETKIDFERMLKIAVDQHGYHGYIGIEYEGQRLSEPDGIKACRDLLLKLQG